MALKRWKMEKRDDRLTGILAEACGIDRFLAEILVTRGKTGYETAAPFLNDTAEWENPFSMADMDKAVARIRQAMDGGEKITVYGDYDCDGVTSTAVLYTYLLAGGARVDSYIPKRDGEGYGLNEAAIRQLAARGTNLIVTVDNGISALSEIDLARTLGMDVVVTDHHQPGETLPTAVAVVDPHRVDDASRFKPLAGVGVVFRLLSALELDADGGMTPTDACESILENFGELIALGTVGDVVPLLGENRRLVRRGIDGMRQSCNQMGLLALMKTAAVAPETVTARQLAFALAPRINAAGRMGGAETALALLLCEEYEADEADRLAAELDEKNKLRQEQERTILTDVDRLLQQEPALLQGRLLILAGTGWHMGVLGIAAARLLERYGKPTLLMTADGDAYKGSARSLGDFHLFEALAANADCLTRFGGHKLAAGFSLSADRLSAFRQGMEAYAAAHYARMPHPTLIIDKLLLPDELTVDHIRSLAALAPFGAENEEPLFLLPSATLTAVTPLSGDKHLRLQCRYGEKSVTAMLFSTAARQFPYPVGTRLDLVVNAQLSSYRGELSVSLKVRDLRPTGFRQDRFFAAKDCVEAFFREEPLQKQLLEHIRPDRADLTALYRWLQTNGGFFGDLESIATVFDQSRFSYAKLRIMLTVFQELGLVEIPPAQDAVLLCPVTGKVQLEQAPVLRRLAAQLQ